MEQLKTTVVDYKNGIFAIDQQMVRAFLLTGDKDALLLDTGAVRVDIKDIISKITKLPVTLALTHADGDHIGNLPDFEEAYINENDVNAVRLHTGCENTRLYKLSNGDILRYGGRELEVIFTPGHTAGSVCLLDRKNKILFSGDTVSFGPVFMFGARRDDGDFIRSLEMLKKMKDNGEYDTVYCCHNACPISADTVDDMLACMRGIADKTITGTPAMMPVPSQDKPLIYKYGKCSVLHT